MYRVGGETVSANDKLSTITGTVIIIWIGLHFYLKDITRCIYASFLFKNWRNSKFDTIYKTIYSKEFIENDRNFIRKLKVQLNTYIDEYKYNNKGSLESIITIIISSLLTITITSYTIASQANKELVSQIIKNLNGDFLTIFCFIIDAYGIVGIFREIASSKFEYYLMVKNILDEVEKDDPKNYYTFRIRNEN